MKKYRWSKCKLHGTITDLGIDCKTTKAKVTLLLDTKNLSNVEQLTQDKLNIEIKKYRKPRSLNANNYAWKLITELADVMKLSKEEVYFLILQRYGQSQMVSVTADINVEGYFKYYIEAGGSNLNGKDFKHYKVYKGSSEFDTREMAVLIDGIVSDCKEQDIETMTPKELSRLKQEWH